MKINSQEMTQREIEQEKRVMYWEKYHSMPGKMTDYFDMDYFDDWSAIA
jgi:hypothetical protein